MTRRLLVLGTIFAILVAGAAPLAAQGTGSISGRVTAPTGDGLGGVSIEASSDVLPQPRSTVSSLDGSFRFPVLPPGTYTLRFTMEALAEQSRVVQVLLDSNSAVEVQLSPEAIQAEIVVIDTTSLVDATSAEIKTAIGNEEIESLPVGQEYRDLQKLIPGVQYSELAIRGPSAGGSGQDNVYLYDGVSVNLPLFGTLSAEPSTHDVDQVSFIRGGAKATDFNRAAGFTMNSISKSGTNRFRGEASYKLQPNGLRATSDDPNLSYDEDDDWATVSIGGPMVRDHLFYYLSYYRPTATLENRANVYGTVPNYDSSRDEYFGRLSFQPTQSLLLNGSYRDSDRHVDAASVDTFEAASAALTEDATLEIGILEGTWTVGSSSFVSFKYTDFANETGSVPDNLLPFSPAADGSVKLDIANLPSQGRLTVPILRSGLPGYNAFVTPYIQQYGYLANGVPTGGGVVGVGSQITFNDFYRESAQAGYDLFLGSTVSHTLHFGYQWSLDEEDLDRVSNGWGNIEILGGRLSTAGQPVFFRATPLQTGITGLGPTLQNIHSELESQNLEINDDIRWGDWSFNVGIVVSNDQLFGQGLTPDAGDPSGFRLCLTCKYKMYEVDFEDQIQPRLGAVWAYDDKGTVYANFARYHPAASSLPRAASWARNTAVTRNADFDANGNLIAIQALSASSGKFFQEDLDPRATDEYLIGATRQLSRHWSGRLSARHRRSYNFWEDTNNDARTRYNPPPGIPREPYIPNLSELTANIGGSSYVIAELDGAFTKYYEVAAEAEVRSGRLYGRGSYVWSHYYGNFDQDNTSGDYIDNDYSAFIGSSNIADGAGRQLWDFKYGNLRGDRRHQFKVYGNYQLDWNASVGAYAIYQSGQPWETWDVEFYRALTSSSSNTIRFSEPAGSHTSDDHYQLDLNYTQNFDLGDKFEIGVVADVFNVLDEQTGYAIQPVISNAGYGTPTEYFDPRRVRLTVRLRY